MTRWGWLVLLCAPLLALLVVLLVVLVRRVEAEPATVVRVVTVEVDPGLFDRLFPAPPPTTSAVEVRRPMLQSAPTPRARTAPIVRGPRTWTWDQLAQCESGGNWSDTRKGYQGGVHFHPKTWDRYRTRWLNDPTLPEDAHLATREQQIRVAEKVLELEGPGAWPVCSYRVGMR